MSNDRGALVALDRIHMGVVRRTKGKRETSDMELGTSSHLLTEEVIVVIGLLPLGGYLKTCSSPRSPLRSHSMVCSKNHLFIVGIGPICDKEL